MTFDDLTNELIDRAFDGLTDPRAARYINVARAELDRMYLWPWREKSASGAAPLAVSDLGTIQSVQATTLQNTPLWKADYGWLADTYGDLTLTGTAQYYYLSSTSGTQTVTVFPVSTASIAVRYWKVTPDLANGTDVPLSPSEFHYTIVDLAVRRAYRDNDEHDNAAALQPEIDNAVSQMLDAYPPGMADGPDAYVGFTGASEDC